MKILKIKACNECPFKKATYKKAVGERERVSGYHCSHNEFRGPPNYGMRKIIMRIHDRGEMPKWCPLQDEFSRTWKSYP
jgi:hypothetical protein